MKKLLEKLLNRETIAYLIFGVLTTLLNWALFWLGTKLFGDRFALLINVFCFLAAASFAYVTNKLFVFDSRSWASAVLRREIPSFFAARVFSFVLEEAGLWLCRDVLHVGRFSVLGVGGLMIAKIVLSVVVVVLNYIFSKLFIFKKPGAVRDSAEADSAAEPAATPDTSAPACSAPVDGELEARLDQTETEKP